MADIGEMTAYFAEVVCERTAEPGDDLVSWIITGAADSNDALTARDLVSFCTLLLVAGNETTTNLLGNAYHTFFDIPPNTNASGGTRISDEWSRRSSVTTLPFRESCGSRITRCASAMSSSLAMLSS